MAIVYENHCVDCGFPCEGNSCPNRNVLVLYCDSCKKPVDLLRNYNGDQWCEECILNEFDEVEVEE